MQTIWVGRQRADIVFASSPRPIAAGQVQRSVLPRPSLQGVRKVSSIFAADSGLIFIISSIGRHSPLKRKKDHILQL